jgi:hypothetical protein
LAHVEPVPPAGESWIQGVLTDQAGHPLENVNVEVWPQDVSAVSPVASNLSYAGDPDDATRQSGVFRVAVPAGTPYRLSFSTVGGTEDGDNFRMQNYGDGRPIMTRTHGTVAITSGTAIVTSSGRVIDLGTIQLARQGTVESQTTAKLTRAKVHAGRRAKVVATVSSPFVTDVTGRLQVRVNGKKVSHTLTALEHGRATVRLPKLERGSHRVRVIFKGSSTVARSQATAVRLKVVKR